VNVVELKRKAGEHAAQFVTSGAVVGLGHGTTAIWAVRRIAERLRSGDLRDILGVPCSRHVEEEARALDIPLTTLGDHPALDLTIDGADEVAPNLDLIKGRGGALLREKMVAQATAREIIVVDESKLVQVLGTRVPVPVEVVEFGWRSQVRYLEGLGAHVTPRLADDGRELYRTDQGNLILDCDFGPIPDPPDLAGRLETRAGILEHGLFLGLASEVVVGAADGVRHLTRETAESETA
jgi:ribose 5-phosphate isomerase A